MRVALPGSVRSAASITIALLALQAAPASAISPQTLTDPTADNCRPYTTPPGTWCGPDITQAVFTTPGDGNLHIDVTYASLPTNMFSGGFSVTEKPEYVEVGIYPKTATTPNLFAAPGTFRVSQFGQQPSLQSVGTGGFTVVAPVTTTLRALGIDIAVPLAPLGDPAQFRYAVNAGSIGETIPEHPDLAPDTGLFDLAGDAPPAVPTPTPPTPTPATPSPAGGSPAPVAAPRIKALSGIPAKQRGNVIAGTVDVSVSGDLTVEALVPAARLSAKSKLKSIGKVTRRGLKAGKVSFRLPLRPSARRKLAGRKTQVTLRITLKPASGAAITQTRKMTLTVPR